MPFLHFEDNIHGIWHELDRKIIIPNCEKLNVYTLLENIGPVEIIMIRWYLINERQIYIELYESIDLTDSLQY